MIILGWKLNLDALLARIIYRWRGRILLVAMLLVGTWGFLSGALPPFWRGRATLVAQAAEGARIRIDGQAWQPSIYAGSHTITAALPDGRMSWAHLSLKAGQTLTITLPPGLPPPRELPVQPPTPSTRITRIWWADEAWRVESVPSDTQSKTNNQPHSDSIGRQTMAISPAKTERLTTLDAYSGLADQLHLDGQLLEAVYRPEETAYRGSAEGKLLVRGWQQDEVSISLAAPLTLVRFSPNGQALLLGEQVAPGGEQLSIVWRDGKRSSLLTVPGSITRLTWKPDSRAFVVHSTQSKRLMLTLVRLQPSVATTIVAELSRAHFSDDLPPLAWEQHALLWVAPDEHQRPALWSATLQALIPERLADLDARAITRLADGSLRIVTERNGRVVIGRMQGRLFIGEAVLKHVPPAKDLTGEWQGNQLLLMGDDRAWLIELAEQAVSTKGAIP